ncbi:hypothetical protein GCM10027442_04020 [Emticicia fontis]
MENFEYGTTGYKNEGWVDERIFNGLHTIEDILNFNEDTIEPVIFSANINKMEVEYLGDDHYPVQEYKVHGEDFKLKGLINKIIEWNAYESDSYVYSEIQPVYDSI